MTLLSLSASRLKTARACARLDHYEYDLGYRPVAEAGETRLGSLTHRGLNAWWSSLIDGTLADPALRSAEALAAALLAIRTPDRGKPAPDPLDVVIAEALLEAYHARWFDETARFDVVSVELPFAVPLLNPATGAASRTWELRGRIDAIARDPDKRLLEVEHKTSGEDISPGSLYWRRLRMDSQVSVYYAAADELGLDVEGCLYDVIGKPRIRPYKATPEATRRYTKGKACKACGGSGALDGGNLSAALDDRCATCGGSGWTEAPRLDARQHDRDETLDEFRERLRAVLAEDPARYFQRGTVVRLEAELEEHRFDVWQTAQRLREEQRLGRHPRNTDACARFGRTCGFLDVCEGNASLDDPAKFTKKEMTNGRHAS